jgi:hypothetical protein
VHQPRGEALEQLPLPENDDRFVPDPPRDVVVTLEARRPRRAQERDEEPRPPEEEAAADGEERGQRDGPGGDRYDRTFRSSALMAGTTSCRSPMTA